MAVNQSMEGKKYPPHIYEVGKEKIREFAQAIGDGNPVYSDEGAAEKVGFDSVVAPPTFAAVYTAGAMGPVITDPELGINLMLMVHGEQEYEWHNPVLAGDVITTEVTVDKIFEKKGMDFVVLKAESSNQRGEPVVTGYSTLVVRRG